MTQATATRDLKPAARRLVNGFQMIPSRWLPDITEKQDNDELLHNVAHGYAFIVSDSCDRRAIEGLLRSPVPTDIEELQDFIEEWDLGIDIEDYVTEPHAMERIADAANPYSRLERTYDMERLREAVEWEWDCIPNDRCALYMAGWLLIGDTGLWAREFDGALIIGINGGGYDFYEAHWIPLYKAMGYGWHKVEA